MRKYPFIPFICLMATIFCLSGASAQVPVMTPDQIRPGMVGVGKTVFRGTKIDTFGVEVVDVMRNVLGPKEDVILARLSGGPLPLEKTGVIAGMSGSPVYIDGKLIGAVALTWPFSKEPICGITPISDMLDAMNRASEDRTLPSGKSQRDGASPRMARSPLEGEVFRPVAVPLTASGFAPEALIQLRSELSAYGLLPTQGGGGTDTTLAAGPLEPGAALGVQLLRGDLSLTGIGTLTYRDGNRVVAFGHPMLSGGRSSFPMTSAHIYGVIPSQYFSFKIGAASTVQGEIVEDRAPGVVGLIGQTANLVPVTVTIRSGSRSRDYQFEMIRHPDLTPILARNSLLSILMSAEKESGDITTRTRTIIRLEGYPDIHLENAYSGAQALGLTILDLVKPLDALMDNPFLSVPVRDVRFEIAVDESLHTASVGEIRTPGGKFRPGETVPFEVLLRSFHGSERTISGQMILPPYVPHGPLALWAGSAANAEKLDAKRAPGRYAPRNFAHLLDLLRDEERNDDLVVEVISQDRGVTVDGEELLSPPSSVLSILRMARQSGALDRTEGAVVARVRIRTDFVLSGQQQTAMVVEAE